MIRPELSAKQIENFWRNFRREGECLLYTHKLRGDGKGYGQVRIATYSDTEGDEGYYLKTWFVHRLAYVLRHGPIPDSIDVLHHCDVRHCVEATHLFLGTDLENSRDCEAKGRRPHIMPFGEANPGAKLSSTDVITIKSLLDKGNIRQQDIAEMFNISRGNIGHIKSGRTRVYG